MCTQARAKPQLRGSIVDQISMLLGKKATSSAPSTARHPSQQAASRATDGVSMDDPKATELLARATLESLRSSKSLYVTATLPKLEATQPSLKQKRRRV